MISTTKTIPIEKIYPLMGVFDSIAVGKKGTLSCGWELTLPVEGSIENKDYDMMTEAWARAVMVLPPWTVIHRQDCYYERRYHSDVPEQETYLGRGNREMYEGRKYLEHRAFVYLTWADRTLIEKKGVSSGFFGIPGCVRLPERSRYIEWLARCRDFVANLTACRLIGVRPLESDEWAGDERDIIERYMMFGEQGNVMSDLKFGDDRVCAYGKTAVVFELAESSNLPGELSTVTRVDSRSTKDTDIYLSMASKIGPLLDCEHVVNNIVVLPDQTYVGHNMEMEKRKMNAGDDYADNRLNAEEIMDYQDEAYRLGLVTVYAHTNVTAWTRGDDIEPLIGALTTALTSMKVKAVLNQHDTGVIWYAGVPGCAFEVGKENMMKMELRSSLCLFVGETYDRGIPGGFFHFSDRNRHTPVPLDTLGLAMAKGYIQAFNGAICGQTGSGKSFLCNLYLRQAYENAKASVFIIDSGDSYEGVTSVIREESGGVDGQYFTWTVDNPLSFNPFTDYTLWLDSRGNLRADNNSVNFVMSFLQMLWDAKKNGGWTDDMKPILKRTVRDFVKQRIDDRSGLPLLNDYYDFLRDVVRPRMESAEGYEIGPGLSVHTDRFDMEGFQSALAEYTHDGGYAFLMNNPQPEDIFTSRWVVFELNKISKNDKKFYSLVVLTLMHNFEIKMRENKDLFKILLVDEAWMAIANETSAPFLREIWKTSRKYSCGAYVATQQMDDLLSSPVVKDAIMDNSDIKMVLDQSKNLSKLDRIVEMMSLPAHSRDLIGSVGQGMDPAYGEYREVFISIGNKFCGVYTTEASRQECIAYESNIKKKADFINRSKLYKSPTTAIDEIISEKDSKIKDFGYASK